MHTELPDWVRLQKALAVEAERGFTDLVGKQYRFSEFLTLSFGKPPAALPLSDRRRWQEMAAQFASYPQLALEERQHLVAEARRYLHQIDKAEQESRGAISEQGNRGEKQISNPKSKISLPRTTPLIESNRVKEANQRIAPNLEQPLASLAEVGQRRGSYLARLGLYSVRDMLFYYPR